MKCSDVMKRLEVLAPLEFAESWDNSGLLAGRLEKDIKRIYLAVDATDEVIEDAVYFGADMLLTHHPLIFSPLKKVIDTDFIGRRVVKLIQSDICYYAMHTNFDVLGMADAAADEMQLKDRQVLEVTYEDDISKEGIGRYGNLPQSMSLQKCAEYIKRIFELQAVRVYGDMDEIVSVAAISPGSGKSVVADAIKAGVDVLVTGDIDHHTGIDLVAQGVNVIDAGHYGLEKIFIPYMKDYIARNLAGIEVETAQVKSPYEVI